LFPNGNLNNTFNSKKYKLNKIFLKQKLVFQKKTNFQKKNINLIFLTQWQTLVIKRKSNFQQVFFFFSEIYFFKLQINNKGTALYFNKKNNILSIKSFLITNFLFSFYFYFKLILNSFSLFFFKKLKFKGKGYYIFKTKRNTIAFKFGFAHRVYLYNFFTFIKFLSKTSILIYGINIFDLYWNAKNLKKIKPINIFTGRGIRFNRQIIYKKIGKVNSYR